MNRDPVGFPERIRAILSQQQRHSLEDPSLMCAAVLVPLLFKEEEWHVLVTQRTEAVEHHRGQISFPGGGCDPEDVSLLDTALRETFEEIGVPPAAVEVLGELDDYATITNFSVTPFVGVIPYPFPYQLNPDEVDAIIEVPLSFLNDPAHLRMEYREYDGHMHDVYFWDYGPALYQGRPRIYTIWGLTARILKDFLSLVSSA
jgi:8-oxo-dGTP pyrophosphatase MutT (NUDIX family)